MFFSGDVFLSLVWYVKNKAIGIGELERSREPFGKLEKSWFLTLVDLWSSYGWIPEVGSSLG